MPPLHCHNSGNFLLDLLPPSAGNALAPWLGVEPLIQGAVLTRRLRPVTRIWFPRLGLVSVTVTLGDGRVTETAAIGRDGCIGLDAVFEPAAAISDSVVQIAGDALVIRAERLRSIVATHPAAAAGFARYSRALTAQLQQLVACNTLHRLEERCCRWLLTAQHRSGTDALPVTQERLADLLGAARPGTSLVLSALQRANLISLRRRRIEIRDRQGLRARVCECHDVIDQIRARITRSASPR